MSATANGKRFTILDRVSSEYAASFSDVFLPASSRQVLAQGGSPPTRSRTSTSRSWRRSCAYASRGRWGLAKATALQQARARESIGVSFPGGCRPRGNDLPGGADSTCCWMLSAGVAQRPKSRSSWRRWRRITLPVLPARGR